MREDQVEKIVELLEKLIEQNEEILEKLINLSTPGSSYGIDTYDED